MDGVYRIFHEFSVFRMTSKFRSFQNRIHKFQTLEKTDSNTGLVLWREVLSLIGAKSFDMAEWVQKPRSEKDLIGKSKYFSYVFSPSYRNNTLSMQFYDLPVPWRANLVCPTCFEGQNTPMGLVIWTLYDDKVYFVISQTHMSETVMSRSLRKWHSVTKLTWAIKRYRERYKLDIFRPQKW